MAEASTLVACPVCGSYFSQQDIELHAALHFSQADGAAEGLEAVAPQHDHAAAQAVCVQPPEPIVIDDECIQDTVDFDDTPLNSVHSTGRAWLPAGASASHHTAAAGAGGSYAASAAHSEPVTCSHSNCGVQVALHELDSHEEAHR